MSRFSIPISPEAPERILMVKKYILIYTFYPFLKEFVSVFNSYLARGFCLGYQCFFQGLRPSPYHPCDKTSGYKRLLRLGPSGSKGILSSHLFPYGNTPFHNYDTAFCTFRLDFRFFIPDFTISTDNIMPVSILNGQHYARDRKYFKRTRIRNYQFIIYDYFTCYPKTISKTSSYRTMF